MKRIRDGINRLYWKVTMKQLDGIGVIEIILILVVIIGLVLIFRNQIEKIISSAFKSITGNASGIEQSINITPKP